MVILSLVGPADNPEVTVEFRDALIVGENSYVSLEEARDYIEGNWEIVV